MLGILTVEEDKIDESSGNTKHESFDQLAQRIQLDETLREELRIAIQENHDVTFEDVVNVFTGNEMDFDAIDRVVEVFQTVVKKVMKIDDKHKITRLFVELRDQACV